MASRNVLRATVVVTLLALVGVSTVGAATARTMGKNDVYLDAADEPCVLVSAGDVQSALGLTDTDGVGTARDLETLGACQYGDSPGALYQIANTFKTDGGRGVKELCRKAKADGRPEYRKVTGVGVEPARVHDIGPRTPDADDGVVRAPQGRTAPDVRAGQCNGGREPGQSRLLRVATGTRGRAHRDRHQGDQLISRRPT
jgi:hypothetical protein